jgi:hypothetical protein
LNAQGGTQKHFGNFIKPHVVSGPRGTYPIPVKSEEGGADRRHENGNFRVCQTPILRMPLLVDEFLSNFNISRILFEYSII